MFRIVFQTTIYIIYVQQLYYDTHKVVWNCVTYDTLVIIVLQKEYYYHVFAFTCILLL